MKVMAFYVLALLVSGCTNQDVYNAVQTNQRNQCDQLTGSQRDTCIKQLAPDYSTYKREREDLNKRQE